MKSVKIFLFLVAFTLSCSSYSLSITPKKYQEPEINTNPVPIDFNSRTIETLINQEKKLKSFYQFNYTFRQRILKHMESLYKKNQLQKNSDINYDLVNDIRKELQQHHKNLNELSKIKKCPVKDKTLLKSRKENPFPNSLYLKEIQMFLDYKTEKEIVQKAYCNLRLKRLIYQKALKRNSKNINQALQIIENKKLKSYNIKNKTLYINNENSIKFSELLSGIIHGQFDKIINTEKELHFSLFEIQFHHSLNAENYSNGVYLYFYHKNNIVRITTLFMTSHDDIPSENYKRTQKVRYYKIKDFSKMNKKEKINYCSSLYENISKDKIIKHEINNRLNYNLTQCQNHTQKIIPQD